MTLREITRDYIPETHRKFRREYWGFLESEMFFGENGIPMFRGRPENLVRKLGKSNKEANDWYECDTNGEKLIPKEPYSLKIAPRRSPIQDALDKINKEFERDELRKIPSPEPTDKDGWKELWERGVEVEASFVNIEIWNKVKRPKGVSFTHDKGEVKFRRQGYEQVQPV